MFYGYRGITLILLFESILYSIEVFYEKSCTLYSTKVMYQVCITLESVEWFVFYSTKVMYPVPLYLVSCIALMSCILYNTNVLYCLLQNYVFLSSKARRSHLLKRSPREVKWTILYRKKHKKGIEEELTKKRNRRTQKFQRAIVGASLTDILAKRWVTVGLWAL